MLKVVSFVFNVWLCASNTLKNCADCARSIEILRERSCVWDHTLKLAKFICIASVALFTYVAFVLMLHKTSYRVLYVACQSRWCCMTMLWWLKMNGFKPFVVLNTNRVSADDMCIEFEITGEHGLERELGGYFCDPLKLEHLPIIISLVYSNEKKEQSVVFLQCIFKIAHRR